MVYRAFSTPPENIRSSNDVAHRLPDHAYSPLFTAGILNSSHVYGHDQGRFPSHLTFQQHVHQTPHKITPNKSGLPSPFSVSSASPSMKKKQSSASLARSLTSSQSGSIKTPSKLATERDPRVSSKPKIEWWRGRSSSFVANKERTSEEKLLVNKGGWLRQSDVWMSPDEVLVQGNAFPRNDKLPALGLLRPLHGLPLPQDTAVHLPQEPPRIKKKSSFGPFKFKNFFQSSKGKEGSVARNHRLGELSTVLVTSDRVNQPDQPPYKTASLLSRRDQRSTYNSQTHFHRPIPRPPPICTSFPRATGFESPYAPTSYCDSPQYILPYMADAGDGRDPPFLPYPPTVPQTQHTAYNSEFPFHIVPSYHAENDPMEQLAMQDEPTERGRVTSAAFEYQEFETDIRNSAHLDSGNATNEGDGRSDTIYSANAMSPFVQGSYTDSDMKIKRLTSGKRESKVLPLMPISPQSINSSHRFPVVEAVKPLSIGRNYPRSRSTALTDVYGTNADTLRPTHSTPGHTRQHAYSDSAEHTRIEEDPKDIRLTWGMTRQFSDLGVDSFGDMESATYDNPRW